MTEQRPVGWGRIPVALIWDLAIQLFREAWRWLTRPRHSRQCRRTGRGRCRSCSRYLRELADQPELYP